jgi:hypothetical protein
VDAERPHSVPKDRKVSEVPPAGRFGKTQRVPRQLMSTLTKERRAWEAGAARKTRPSPDGGCQKGHYRPLPKEFRRDGFHYRQIKREGDVVIYEQAWLGCAEPSLSYEVVCVRRREGFQIADRFVNAAEIYPNLEAWGVDGFTFTNRNKAWARFFEISLEEPAKERKEVNLKWENLLESSSATLNT